MSFPSGIAQSYVLLSSSAASFGHVEFKLFGFRHSKIHVNKLNLTLQLLLDTHITTTHIRYSHSHHLRWKHWYSICDSFVQFGGILQDYLWFN